MTVADRHVPDDEHINDLPCGRIDPHSDHYWRTDGKRWRYLDDPTTVYCVGVGPEIAAEPPYCAGLGAHSTGDHCPCTTGDDGNPSACCWCGWDPRQPATADRA